ncbi:16S rRNA (uracil(1498)-N(3))-methyltransferase [Helicobacter sp. 11S02596-1]|uniref:16S rRNA (uracil(1498)-N(3))-methyltransferase n=1 Tax=Helicobacter sp. 11S02596-1 TaxID=1476194 RepID=UPI000BA609A1|nr:16S rRNA (uracil(1498)-N(3))-methyltransferase [Helicobacter sp. 11S02596-1]PAF44859.1 16S rRNA (uracil(1498)-N(3))-methyltransferase [Helicobacter sp. 11S02596-1]
MRFAYAPDAGVASLVIAGELYTHLYHSRRTKLEKKLFFRNLNDSYLYTYEQTNISRKHAELRLCTRVDMPVLPNREIHIIWAIIESKTIEKTLPYLNQIGVGKITFFYANRSQKNEKISIERLTKILIHSCEQCGRSALMDIEILPDSQSAHKQYPKACVFDFGGKDIYRYPPSLKDGIFIGPEGGFDLAEKTLFKDCSTYSIATDFTLKSECATLLLASLGR